MPRENPEKTIQTETDNTQRESTPTNDSSQVGKEAEERGNSMFETEQKLIERTHISSADQTISVDVSPLSSLRDISDEKKFTDALVVDTEYNETMGGLVDTVTITVEYDEGEYSYELKSPPDLDGTKLHRLLQSNMDLSDTPKIGDLTTVTVVETPDNNVALYIPPRKRRLNLGFTAFGKDIVDKTVTHPLSRGKRLVSSLQKWMYSHTPVTDIDLTSRTSPDTYKVRYFNGDDKLQKINIFICLLAAFLIFFSSFHPMVILFLQSVMTLAINILDYDPGSYVFSEQNPYY